MIKYPWLLLILLAASALLCAAKLEGAASKSTAPAQSKQVSPGTGNAADTKGDANAAEIRQAIKRILDRPDFRLAQSTEPRPLPKWLQAFKDAWNKFWDRFAESGTRLAEGAPWLPYAIMAVAAALLLLMVWRVISESFFEQKTMRAGTQAANSLTPAKLYALALAAYADGDIQQAIRLLFRAAILSLFGESARTTPTYLLSTKLVAMPSVPQEDFRTLKRCFDTTYYGGTTATRQDFESAREITLKLRRLNEEVLDEG